MSNSSSTRMHNKSGLTGLSLLENSDAVIATWAREPCTILLLKSRPFVWIVRVYSCLRKMAATAINNARWRLAIKSLRLKSLVGQLWKRCKPPKIGTPYLSLTYVGLGTVVAMLNTL